MMQRQKKMEEGHRFDGECPPCCPSEQLQGVVVEMPPPIMTLFNIMSRDATGHF